MYMKKIAILIIASAMAAGGMAQKRPPAYKTLTFDVKGCRLEMVYVHGGEFVMGCDEGMEAYGKVDERPYHPVRVNSFYMGRYEVTQRLWKAVMGSNPSNFRGDDCPVEQVSYDDAQEFIRRLNAFSGKKFRLPTEAEWEYAARGGRYGRGKNYAGDNDPLRAGWGMLNSGDSTHLAGGLVPNELGLYDMTGNVWEWCSDWYDSDEYGWRNRDILFPAPPSWVHTRDDFKRWADTPYDQKPSAARAMATQRAASSQSVKHALTVDSYSVIDNPQGPESGECRVGRGGSWCDVPEDMRVSYRNFWMPDRRLSNVGFRLAMEYDKDDSALAWMPGQYVLDSIADGEQYRASGLEVIMRRENGVLKDCSAWLPTGWCALPKATCNTTQAPSDGAWPTGRRTISAKATRSSRRAMPDGPTSLPGARAATATKTPRNWSPTPPCWATGPTRTSTAPATTGAYTTASQAAAAAQGCGGR